MNEIWKVEVREAWKYRDGASIDYFTLYIPEDITGYELYRKRGEQFNYLRSWLRGIYPVPEARDKYEIYLAVEHIPSGRAERMDIYKEGTVYRTKHKSTLLTLEASVTFMKRQLIKYFGKEETK